MQISAIQTSADEATSIVLVRVSYHEGLLLLSPETIYLVTFDKILGRATVHSNGVTRRTKVPIEDLDNTSVAEERAILCAIHFPGEEAAS